MNKLENVNYKIQNYLLIIKDYSLSVNFWIFITAKIWVPWFLMKRSWIFATNSSFKVSISSELAAFKNRLFINLLNPPIDWIRFKKFKYDCSGLMESLEWVSLRYPSSESPLSSTIWSIRWRKVELSITKLSDYF